MCAEALRRERMRPAATWEKDQKAEVWGPWRSAYGATADDEDGFTLDLPCDEEGTTGLDGREVVGVKLGIEGERLGGI